MVEQMDSAWQLQFEPTACCGAGCTVSVGRWLRTYPDSGWAFVIVGVVAVKQRTEVWIEYGVAFVVDSLNEFLARVDELDQGATIAPGGVEPYRIEHSGFADAIDSREERNAPELTEIEGGYAAKAFYGK